MFFLLDLIAILGDRDLERNFAVFFNSLKFREES